MKATIENELLDTIIAGCEGVTPGPWVHISHAGDFGGKAFEVREADKDPTNKHHWPHRICQSAAGVSYVQPPRNGEHIARLDPATVRSICTELLVLRASAQAAGVVARERYAAIADSWAETEERLAERDAGTENGITHTLIADGMRDVAAAIRSAGLSPQATSVPRADERSLVDQLTGALRFILAFYEPGQTYLDTNAWKVAEAGGRAALAKGEAALAAAPPPPAQPVTDKEAEKRNIGVGMAIAAGIVMVTAGDEVRAREILGAAGYDTEQSLRDDGVDDYDINLLRPLFADDDAGAQP